MIPWNLGDLVFFQKRTQLVWRYRKSELRGQRWGWRRKKPNWKLRDKATAGTSPFLWQGTRSGHSSFDGLNGGGRKVVYVHPYTRHRLNHGAHPLHLLLKLNLHTLLILWLSPSEGSREAVHQRMSYILHLGLADSRAWFSPGSSQGCRTWDFGWCFPSDSESGRMCSPLFCPSSTWESQIIL